MRIHHKYFTSIVKLEGFIWKSKEDKYKGLQHHFFNFIVREIKRK